MKKDKILSITILSIIVLILSGCVPTTPNIPDQGDGINHNPIISDLSASPRTGFINQTNTITCTASDQDDDPLTYRWSKTGGTITITGSGSIIAWKSPATEGTYTITCTVSDNKGGEDKKSVNIEVDDNKYGDQYTIDWSMAESNGWANPLGEGKELITSTAYDYDSGIYLNNHPGKKHMGIDTDGNKENDDVYPIARGTIRKIERGSDPEKMVVIIEHTNSNNEYFFAIYGHVLAREDLGEGTRVCKNIKLGVIKTAGSGPHLHFGINIFSKISDFYYGIYGWGRIPVSANPSEKGWVDPIEYLNNHLPLTSLTPEEIELIRKWGFGGDYVVRWPNGFVDVYDATNYSQMQEVLNQWNAVIGGPVILRLSNNPNSQVKVYYKLIFGYCGNRDVKWNEDYTFSTIDIQISDNASCGYPSTKYALYLFMFKNVAGFKGWTTKGEDVPYEEWTNFTAINDTMKKMVKALYKVPPGYYLCDSKQRKDYSNVIIKNISTSEGVNCLDNGKK